MMRSFARFCDKLVILVTGVNIDANAMATLT
jgi:hypothetical protein